MHPHEPAPRSLALRVTVRINGDRESYWNAWVGIRPERDEVEIYASRDAAVPFAVYPVEDVEIEWRAPGKRPHSKPPT